MRNYTSVTSITLFSNTKLVPVKEGVSLFSFFFSFKNLLMTDTSKADFFFVLFCFVRCLATLIHMDDCTNNIPPTHVL